MRKILLALALLAAGCGEAPAVEPPVDTPVARQMAEPPPDADVQESWRITRHGAEHEIEGYADEVSVLPGSGSGCASPPPRRASPPAPSAWAPTRRRCGSRRGCGGRGRRRRGSSAAAR
ncbi:hypothetical protein ACFQQB_47015 [Nonomuraea rubra]|uniref:hypothetical protein n=1 Tax=Nonomuraea rubra TaxID=46180 RepID=UPI0036085D90